MANTSYHERLTSYHARLTKLLKLHEGFRDRVYKDTQGFLTIGYGHNVEHAVLREVHAADILRDDLKDATSFLDSSYAFIMSTLDAPRKAVLTDMMFNLGPTKFAKFKNFISALEAQDYLAASGEMVDSLWHKQVGRRAKRLEKMMRTGKWPKEILE